MEIFAERLVRFVVGQPSFLNDHRCERTDPSSASVLDSSTTCANIPLIAQGDRLYGALHFEMEKRLFLTDT
jgi:hypothetical protein